MAELKPIKPVKYDPENLHISKEQFLEKRRKAKELAAKMKAYELKAKEEIEAEAKVEKPKEVEKPKKVSKPKAKSPAKPIGEDKSEK